MTLDDLESRVSVDSQLFMEQLICQSDITAFDRKICLPVNDSIESRLCIDWATKHLFTNRDLVILLHCHSSVEESSPEWLGYNIKQEQDSRKLLNELCAQIPFQTLGFSLEGDPRPMLCQTLNDIHPDLVLLKRRTQRDFDGSVGQFLLHNVQTQVLLL
ncbi:hypothetical protein EDD86DRAFT_220679 [Gorgonomyces haynaldii]|nr:hypothetical protein EDD86DRAFT_220679 [Gorgonomyces haynaldii]